MLVDALSHEDEWRVRWRAAQALGEIDGAAADARVFSALAAAVYDNDSDVRQAAREAVNKLTSAAVPMLIDALSHDDWPARIEAARMLSGLNSVSAAQAVPMLVDMLSHDSMQVRLDAVWVLSGIDSAAAAQAVPMLVEALSYRDWRVRQGAAQAFGKIDEAAAEQAVPMLVVALADPDPDVRQAVGETLEKLNGAVTVPMLVAALSSGRWRVRLEATRTLSRIDRAAAKQAVPMLVELLSHEEWQVRVRAAHALGEADDAAAKQAAPMLVEALSHGEWQIRQEAAQALGEINEAIADAPAFSALVAAVDDDDSDVRRAAREALDKLDGAMAIPVLVEALSHEESRVRMEAARMLARVDRAAVEQAVPMLIEALSRGRWRVRQGAAETLGEIDEAAAEQAVPTLVLALGDPTPDVRQAAKETLEKFDGAVTVPVLVEALSNEEWRVRVEAARTLTSVDRAAAEQAVPMLVEVLSHVEWQARQEAAQVLDEIDDSAAEQVAPMLVETLSHDHWQMRAEAARILARFDRAAADQAVPMLVEALSHRDWQVREKAAQALGEIDGAATDASAISGLVAAIGDRDSDVSNAASEAISKISANVTEPSLPLSIALLDLAERFPSKVPEARIWARFLSGGSQDYQILVDWLGSPSELPIEGLKDDPDRVRATLTTFVGALPVMDARSNLSFKIADAADKVASEGQANLTVNDIPLLKRLAGALEAHGRTAHSDRMSAIADDLEPNELARATLLGWGAHVTLWTLLIFVYPHSRPVQTFFFWNKWVRWFVGFGYVPLLLAWVPFLRRRLFKPFRIPLLADAHLGEFDPSAYFVGTRVRVGRNAKPSNLIESLAQIKGQIVLEGESGLGKTMFIRHLLANSPRIIVYLPATKCENGVLAAIQAKLEGPARDPKFLRSLVYAGAIDVVIDGLNEVAADVHARIVEFADTHFAGNLLISTQPMEWTKPANAKEFVLEPLAEEQIGEFLASRAHQLPEDATTTGDDYEAAVADYIEQALGEAETEARSAARRALSNPMDLTVISDMLARGETPNLLDLREQQYRVMADDYKHRQNGAEFPLEKFSERAFELRVSDQQHFEPKEFIDELARMEDHRMVISRPGRDAEGKPIVVKHFRHDKIMDFFLHQAFLGKQHSRQIEYLRDARFRGAYMLLATQLPYPQALALRELLIKHAAETRDHSLSDQFVLLLDQRAAA